MGVLIFALVYSFSVIVFLYIFFREFSKIEKSINKHKLEIGLILSLVLLIILFFF